LNPGLTGDPEDFSGGRLMNVEAVVTATIAASSVSPGRLRPAELPLNLRPRGEKSFPTTNSTEPPPGVPVEIPPWLPRRVKRKVKFRHKPISGSDAESASSQIIGARGMLSATEPDSSGSCCITAATCSRSAARYC
jgi:hypothetical protein